MVQCLEAISARADLTHQGATHQDASCKDSACKGTVRAERKANVPLADQLDLDALNAQFEQATPQEILAWCVGNIPDGLVQTTSFSMLAITHMLYKELSHPVPVIFLDTLHLFQETLDTAAKASFIYDLDLHTYRAVGADSRKAFAKRYGEKLWVRDIEQFYEVTKVEPLQRALNELNVKAWMTGRRRDQSEFRKTLPIFEHVEGRLKINPLANWTKKELWAYTDQHNVMYNPLHDQGYTSIGDEPLTTPTVEGEDERAGRWRGTEKTECGIHW